MFMFVTLCVMCNRPLQCMVCGFNMNYKCLCNVSLESMISVILQSLLLLGGIFLVSLCDVTCATHLKYFQTKINRVIYNLASQFQFRSKWVSMFVYLITCMLELFILCHNQLWVNKGYKFQICRSSECRVTSFRFAVQWW